MTTQKGREFWIREPKDARKGAITVATEVKGQWADYPPLSGAHWLRKPAFKVVEKHAYNKAITALKSLRSELPKNEFVQFVTEETFKELGVSCES